MNDSTSDEPEEERRMANPDPPDKNCMTLPDGSCVGGTRAGLDPCMHEVEEDVKVESPLSLWKIMFSVVVLSLAVIVVAMLISGGDEDSPATPEEVASFVCSQLESGAGNKEALVEWMAADHTEILDETLGEVIEQCPELLAR